MQTEAGSRLHVSQVRWGQWHQDDCTLHAASCESRQFYIPFYVLARCRKGNRCPGGWQFCRIAKESLTWGEGKIFKVNYLSKRKERPQLLGKGLLPLFFGPPPWNTLYSCCILKTPFLIKLVVICTTHRSRRLLCTQNTHDRLHRTTQRNLGTFTGSSQPLLVTLGTNSVSATCSHIRFVDSLYSHT